MKKINKIHIIVLGITVFWFFYDFYDGNGIFDGETALSICVLLASIILVHMIKAIRLYFALYGSNFHFREHLEVYGETMPVSIILPYKIGELFRMYCYGSQMSIYLKGILTILLDRFADTAALITFLVFIRLLTDGKLTTLLVILTIFLLTVLFCFFAFPGIYRFWHQYFLKAGATEHKILGLKILYSINEIYLEMEKIVKGRGMILYILSLAAWGMEIGSLVIRHRIAGGNMGAAISEYLFSAIGGNKVMEFKRFTFVSVMVLFSLKLFLQVTKKLPVKKRLKNESIRGF